VSAAPEDMLARIVAVREELALGEYEQAAAILADLEADLAANREGAAP
jgi:hypothetical protein